MRKHVATFVAGAAVLWLTLLPLLGSPDHLAWLRWKIGTWAIAGLAFFALYLQVRWTMQQEKQQEKLEQEMLALLRKIANDVKKREAGRRAPTKRSTFSLQAA